MKKDNSMKKIYIICNKDDYFAQDALIGEIEHHNLEFDFTGSINDSDAIILIVGANTNNLDGFFQELNIAKNLDKPLLAIYSHSLNFSCDDFTIYKWDWNRIESFIRNL